MSEEGPHPAVDVQKTGEQATDEEVSQAIEEQHHQMDGHTHSEKTRHWLTNDVGFLWVLVCYMTVWAVVKLSPHLSVSTVQMSHGGDWGAFLALLAAITWGFGTGFLKAISEVKG